jgi:RNA polymerase sigma-70 factor (ECF subfamily)
LVDSRDEEIYRKHADELIRFATTLVGTAAAEDVFSGAILKAMSSHSWHMVTEHRAYLFRAVFNEAIGTKRSDRRRGLRETTAAPHEDGESAHLGIEVADAMSRLSVRQRSVLFLAYWLDLTVEEIATTLVLSRRSTERALTTARSQLEEQLR